MKKFLSLFAAVLFAGSMMAAEVTITPDNCGWTTTAGAQSGVVEGVTIATGQGVVGTVDNVAAIRTYKSQTLTISAESNITKIVITCVANGTEKYGPGNFTATGYTFEAEGPVGTWSGSAKSVALLASGAQVRATSIVVTLDGEGAGEGGGEGGEGGDEVKLDVVYGEAAYFSAYSAWQLNLYKDYNEETDEVTYPDLYIGFSAKSGTAIAGTYAAADLVFAQVFTSENDTAEAVSYATDLVIEHQGEGVYNVKLNFVGDDNVTYVVDWTGEVTAYDGETDEDIVLDEDGGDDPVDPEDLATEGIHTLTPGADAPNAAGSFDKIIDGIQLVWEGAYYNNENNQDFRVYANKTMTITAGAKIVKVEIAGFAKKDLAPAVNKGVITAGTSFDADVTKADLEDPLIVIEEIDAKSVTLTCSKQLRAYTIRVTLEGAEGIEETLAEGKAVKVLREGNVLILKGDKTFNMMGQIVK